MAQASVATRGNSAAHETILAQIAAPRGDIIQLAGSSQSSAKGTGTALVKKMSNGLNAAEHDLGRKDHVGALRIEGAVAANPYLTLGLAAGIGLLVGVMTRR